jgi:hypothetical protein
MLITCAMAKFLFPIGPIQFSFYDQINMWLVGQDHLLQLGVVSSWTRIQLLHMIC